jgi:Fic family protein
MQSQQLLTESEIFKDEVLSGTESTDRPSQEMSERSDYGQNHGQNLIETRCINPVSKSFILHLHEVLTRDSPIHAWKGNTL